MRRPEDRDPHCRSALASPSRERCWRAGSRRPGTMIDRTSLPDDARRPDAPDERREIKAPDHTLPPEAPSPAIRRCAARSGMHQALAHDSAHKHVAGEALYIDDLPEPNGLAHVYF